MTNQVKKTHQQHQYKIAKILKNLCVYKVNKEEINKKRNAKHVCEICNGSYTVKNKAVHMKTKIHIDALQIIK